MYPSEMKKALIRMTLVVGLLMVTGIVTAVSAQTVSGSIGNGTVKRGGSAVGRVVLSIPGELHVNSNNPRSKYAIPTTVKVTSSGAKVGAVRYPAGKTKKFGFSETPINVYEGSPVFTFNVAVPASFKGEVVTVKASVRYQACNDEVCFPPRTREVTLTARVK